MLGPEPTNSLQLNLRATEKILFLANNGEALSQHLPK